VEEVYLNAVHVEPKPYLLMLGELNDHVDFFLWAIDISSRDLDDDGGKWD